MKRLIIFFLIFLFVFPSACLAVTKNFYDTSLTNNVVYNPFQGLGICHYSSPTILNDPAVSWSYDATGAVYWDTVEPIEGQFNWGLIDQLVSLHQNKGKKLWLQVYNTNGTSPQWVKDKVINGKKIAFMGQDYSPTSAPCTNMEKSMPLSWDEGYLTLWRRVIHELAQKYDNNPTVEAIIIMAGGGYGEMTVCKTCGPPSCWMQAAGCCTSTQNSTCTACIDNKFADSVKNLIDLYLSEFQNKPVILQLGSGVPYGPKATASVIKPVLDYAIPKYGMRVLTKSNGWHCGDTIPPTACDWGHSGVCNYFLNGERADRTKYGLEPGFPTDDYQTEACMIGCQSYLSYACLQDRYWSGNNGANLENLRNLRDGLARSLGAKVALKEVTYPEQMAVNSTYNISLTLKNLGNIPPFRPARQGVKDAASSYQVSFQLIQNEQIYYRQEITPNPLSNNWGSGQEIIASGQLAIPAYLFSGNYELRIGLWDPEAKTRARQEYFRVLNKDLLDSQGRAKIGTLAINGLPADCATRPQGDMTCDGKINEQDLQVVLNLWETPIDAVDPSHDEKINETDLTILLKNWQE